MKSNSKNASADLSPSQEYTFGPEEDWINILQPEETKDCIRQDTIGGTTLIFIDRQTRLYPGSQARYTHFREKVMNHSGVDEASTVQIDFIPEIQNVVIHKINIIRNDVCSDKTATSHFRIKQSERSQGEQKYKGYKTLTVFIDDIQLHDEVEVSYTILGSDPAAKEHLALRLYTTSDSLSFQKYRIILSSNIKLYYRNFNTSLEPSMHLFPDSGDQEYCWSFKPESNPSYEDATPPWFEIRPYVEVSTYEQWSEVVDIFTTYYQNLGPIPTALQDVIDDIKAKFDAPPAQIAACLDYTQTSIRYLSLQEPHLTYRPSNLSDILKNGFGDCKDKALVLITMLTLLKIEAYPALISVSDTYQPEGCLPSFRWFDHVIVCVCLDDKLFWLDATASNQAGGLNYRAQVNRGDALIIKPNQNELIRLPLDDRSSYETKEIYDFKLKPTDPIKLTVISKSRGKDAERLRTTLNEGSSTLLSKRYLDFYGQHFKEIEAIAPLQVTDNKDENSIRTIEQYEIKNLESFEGVEDNIRVLAYQLRSYLDFPTKLHRFYPYWINHPMKAKHTIELNIVKAVLTESETNTSIEDDAFILNSKENMYKNKIISTFTYESLNDHVLPERLDEYNAHLNEAYKAVGYYLRKDVLSGEWKDLEDNPEAKPSWTKRIFTFCCYVLIGKLILLTASHFFKEEKKTDRNAIKASLASQDESAKFNNLLRAREKEKTKSFLDNGNK